MGWTGIGIAAIVTIRARKARLYRRINRNGGRCPENPVRDLSGMAAIPSPASVYR
jgi:hypothetical protein